MVSASRQTRCTWSARKRSRPSRKSFDPEPCSATASGGECDRFETRYAKSLGVKHFALAASGSNALVAAMTAVGLGPGRRSHHPGPYLHGDRDFGARRRRHSAHCRHRREPDDRSKRRSRRPSVRARGPSFLSICGAPLATWTPIMEIARRHNLLVVEDACQGVGGAMRAASSARSATSALQLQLL